MITIVTKPDMSIDPGHQWLIVPNTVYGRALELILTGDEWEEHPDDDKLYIAHTADVDTAIGELINTLAHVRFSAPGLVQFRLPLAPAADDTTDAEDDGGLEGA